MLLVLDNCEHVLATTAALSDRLLRFAPQLTIVATSREPLRVPGEVVFRVPSLDIPNPDRSLSPEQLHEYESVSLFVDRAAAAAPGFALDHENAEDVARICFRLDGLPLALELAAGRVGVLSPAAIAERLDDRFRLLRTGSHAGADPPADTDRDAPVEPRPARARRGRSCFAGSRSSPAGSSSTPPSRSATETGCRRWRSPTSWRASRRSHSSTVDEGSRERRYRLLETVRLYARERLADAGEQRAVAGRHADWALALAEREQGSQQLDRETSNLRAALDTLLEHEPHDALRLCVALLPFWLRRIELGEAKRRFATALEASPERTSLAAEALLAAAAIEFRSGALSDGMPLAEQSYAVASEIGDAHREWRALQFLGEFGVAGDATEVALPWLERALALARRERFAAGEAISIHSLGVAAWIAGDLPRADDLIAESIELFRALEESTDTIPSPLNIAEIRLSQPEGLPGLRHLFLDTLQPFVEISCAAAASYALANQAAIARVRGDLVRARTLLDESEGRFEAAGDEVGLATVAVRRAYTSLAERDVPGAHAHLERALDLRAGLSDRRGRGLVLSGLGLVETIAGDYGRAERHLAEAHDIFRRAGDRWGLASTLWRTADLAIARDSLDDAEAALREALAVLGETQRERWIASTLAGLAEVAALRGDVEGAAQLFQDARARYASRDDALGVATIDERLRGLAKEPLRPGKGAPDTPVRQAKTKGRRT